MIGPRNHLGKCIYQGENTGESRGRVKPVWQHQEACGDIIIVFVATGKIREINQSTGTCSAIKSSGKTVIWDSGKN